MTKAIRVTVLGGDAIRNALVSADMGGDHLSRGLTEIVAERPGDRAIDLSFSHIQDVPTLLTDLQDLSIDDPLSQQDNRCDVVIVATTNDAYRLTDLADDPNSAMETLADSLVETVDIIKERTGAHVLVANVATFDPSVTPTSLADLDDEPLSLRAHRVDLILLKLSHLLGVSIIDVDRVTAEAGASRVVPAAFELNSEGSQLVRDETLRVLDDYGFFDERQLAPQVGNRSKSA